MNPIHQSELTDHELNQTYNKRNIYFRDQTIMDTIQKIALAAMATLILFAIIKVWFTQPVLPIKDQAPLTEQVPDIINTQKTPIGFSNKLSNDMNLGSEEGLNMNMGYHSRTTVGEPVGEGTGPNVPDSAVFNPNATGILAFNHHNGTEQTSHFGSDVLDINQFYNKNPEIFHRTNKVNDSNWENQGQEMFQKMLNQTPGKEVQGWNFEHDLNRNI
jgi:hypothetical protein